MSQGLSGDGKVPFELFLHVNSELTGCSCGISERSSPAAGILLSLVKARELEDQ